MDPFRASIEQMQNFATLMEQQTLLAKRAAGLELTRVEGEITIAKARVAVSDTELDVLNVKLSSAAGDDTAIAHLNSLITAVKAERKARASEVEALESYLEIKKEIAETSLGMDPSLVNQVVTLIGDGTGEDDETGEDGETGSRP